MVGTALTSIGLSDLWVLFAIIQRERPLPLSACHMDSKGDLGSISNGLQLQIPDLIGMSLISSDAGWLVTVIYCVPVLQITMQKKMQCMRAISSSEACMPTGPDCTVRAPQMTHTFASHETTDLISCSDGRCFIWVSRAGKGIYPSLVIPGMQVRQACMVSTPMHCLNIVLHAVVEPDGGLCRKRYDSSLLIRTILSVFDKHAVAISFYVLLGCNEEC